MTGWVKGGRAGLTPPPQTVLPLVPQLARLVRMQLLQRTLAEHGGAAATDDVVVQLELAMARTNGRRLQLGGELRASTPSSRRWARGALARNAPPERAYIDAIGAQQRPLEDYIATAVGKVEAQALDALAGISSIVHGLKNIYAELRRIEPGRCALARISTPTVLLKPVVNNAPQVSLLLNEFFTVTGTI